MFFLGWLALCFFVVGAINLYLRYFGLPKDRGGQAAGRVGGCNFRTTGYGPVTFSGSGATVGGSPFSGSVGGGGETGHWINSILSWIYQTQSRVPDFVESWLSALTAEAEKQAKEMQVRFEGIHGSPPEFSNFRTEAASIEKGFTILMNLTLKDVTLQTSTVAKSTAARANQPVKCDVYLQNLTGQVKAVTKFANNDLCLQLCFISEPNIKLQIRPSRADHTIDNSAFDKIVRAAISNATMRVDWTSRSTGRPSSLRIMEPNSVQRFTSDHQVSGQPSRSQSSKSSPLHATFRDDDSYEDNRSSSVLAPEPFIQERQSPRFQSPQTVDIQVQQPRLVQGQYQGQGQYPEMVQGQQYPSTAQGLGQYSSTSQGQQYSSTVQGQQSPSTVQSQQYTGTVQGQQMGIIQGQTSPQTPSQGPKLFIKVVKANGLIDNDFGNCSAFCRVHVDNPPQDFTTNVIRNTVNPCWNEQFMSDVDHGTKQIQFEVLDRDRQPDSGELLGKAVVLVDEIRRMPSSRQIIPLTGKPKSRTSTSGSVTVEFIFQDFLSSSPSTSSAASSAGSGVPFGFPRGGVSVQKQPSLQGTSFSSSAQFTPVTGSSYVNERQSRKDEKPRAASADYSPYASRSGSAAAGPSSGTTQLSAHNMALTSSQPVGSKSQESPTVVVTGAESFKSATLQPSRTASRTTEATNNLDAKKKESFASTLKRKLGRVKIKPRSQSADRTTSHSMREGSLLRPPPSHAGATLKATPSQSTGNTDLSSDPVSAVAGGDDETLRKARSNSFSSSLRRIFRRDKKDMSRESSLTKPSSSSSGHLGRGNGSREALIAEQGSERSRRQNTPVPSGDRFAATGGTDFTYSSSVPSATSPLHNR